MSFSVRIDDPAEQCIARPDCTIRGWCASDNPEILRSVRFLIGTSQLPYSKQLRPDVEETTPGMPCAGFLIPLDLGSYLAVVRNNELLLHVVARGEEPVPVRFQIAPGVIAKCLAAAGGC